MTSPALLVKYAWVLTVALNGLPLATTLTLRPDIFHVKRQSGSVTPVDDHFTPHEAPINWYALGDSYTAGPGTGDDFDNDEACRRNNGSYAIQMESDFPFNEPNDMDFIACSGHIAPDSLRDLDLIQQNKADFMVMTLGGNDVGFAEIAKQCLIFPELIPFNDCDESIENARQSIKNQKLENDVHAVYDGVFGKMQNDRQYQLYHIFYHRFFNEQTDWCNNHRFIEFAGQGTPKVSLELRKKINTLVDEMNKRLEDIAYNYIQKQSGESWSQGTRLFAINPDKLTRDNGDTYGLFDGHRFCEPGVKDFKDPSVWFFSVKDEDSVQKREFTLPEDITSSFHPRTAGFRAIKRMLQRSLQKNRPAEA